MSFEIFTALFVFMLVALITPGPNNTMLLSSGVTFGLKRSAAHICGVNIGFALMAFMVCLGLGAVFMASPLLHNALRFICATYLFWLAWKIANSGATQDSDAAAQPQTFIQAALFQWVNPKAWTMALTAISAYAPKSQGWIGVLMVAAMFGAINLPATGTWAVMGAKMRRFFGEPVRLKIFNIIAAILLVASLYPMVAGLLAT